MVSATTDSPITVTAQPEPAALIASGDIGQPGRPHLRDQAQDPGVGPVTQPEPRRLLREQERAGHDDDREEQPRRGADRDRMWQRRGRAGRAALAACPLAGVPVAGLAAASAGRALGRGCRARRWCALPSRSRHILPSRDQRLRAQPAAGDGAGVHPVQLHPPVEVAQRSGGQAGRDRIERGEQPRAVPLDGAPADQRGDVLGRLQGAVVGRTTRCRSAMPGSVVNSSAAPIWSASSACRVSGPPVSVGHEGLEPQPVDPLQPGQAISPFPAFGRARRTPGAVPL